MTPTRTTALPCDDCGQVPAVAEVERRVCEQLVRTRRITVSGVREYRCACGPSIEWPALGPLLDGVFASQDLAQSWAWREGRWIREPD